ncbi:hypothetical protein PI125_g1003 [Phytophthora idaei]|nr:hypothetical protein PI125_g1003 [Phytophthora idaei]
MTKRQLYAQLEAARCNQNGSVEGHLNYMCQLHSRLKTVGMTLDDAVFSGMLVSSLPSNERFDRLQGYVDTGMSSVDTLDKVVAMAITFDKANKADYQLQRSFGSNKSSSGPPQQTKSHTGGGRKPENKNPKREEAQHQRDKDRRLGTCFGCHKPGHTKRDCPSGSGGNRGGGGQATGLFSASLVLTESAMGQALAGRRNSDRARPSEQKKAPAVGAEGMAGADDSSNRSTASRRTSQNKKTKPSYRPEAWVYDCGANRHLVGDKRYFVEYRSLTAAEREKETVQGYNGTSAPIGIGTIDLWVVVNGGHVALRLEQVYFSPARPNLFSQSVARQQGYTVDYDDGSTVYTLSKNEATALQAPVKTACGLWMFTAHNEFLPGECSPVVPKAMINFAPRDGVADLQCWHERLGPLNPQYIRKMADEGLVEGMMLRRRQFDTCEACQLGKQRAKAALQHLDRGVAQRNELVFADLLFPPKNYNCTRFKAVLVIMDAHTRFVTMYPVKDKTKEEINPLIRRYIAWAERQCPECEVRTVFSDGGGEFVNDEIMNWYQNKGITHTATPRNSSRPNMVERIHQTLVGMMKAMVKEAGVPTSFWVDAFHYAVYLKNRSYSTPIGHTPYEAMWGRMPDIHHVRKFGALAYVHTKLDPLRHKFADNCRVGFVLGYRESALGCKIYFPKEGTALFGGQVTVNEQVLYKDWYGPEFEDTVRQWAVDACPDLTSAGRRDYDLPAVGGRENGADEHHDTLDEDGALAEAEESIEELQRAPEAPRASWMNRQPPTFGDEMVFTNPVRTSCRKSDEPTRADDEDVDMGDEQEATASASGREDAADGDYGEDQADPDMDAIMAEEKDPQDVESNEGNTPVAGEEDTLENDAEGYISPHEEDVQSDQPYDSQEENENDSNSDESSTSSIHEVTPPILTGHRRAREDGESMLSGEAERKRNRTGLVAVGGDAEEEPDALEAFAVYAAIAAVTAMETEPEHKLWHESEVRLPRTFKQAMASPQHKEWWKGMEREVAAMDEKYVLELVPEDEMPAGKKALQTMWRFQIKTDNDGNVIRFRPRLCARGDKQEPGIDFLVMETFSPVARMASFRLFVALCVLLELDPFSCDINTAYLNARLKIKHFISRIAGFPLRKGWVYKVKHAIYDLHQSGREWYEELDSWLTGRRWRRCTTEPCLYVYTEDGVTAILLVYVDDLILATNDEKCKVEFSQALNTKYGIKDQGRLHEYLGIQVDWTNEGAFLHQVKYAKDVLNRFGFGDARGCRSPMDPTTKLSAAPAHCEPKEIVIEYRAAIGALMYTATSTRPDLAYPVGYLCRFVGNPTVQHGGALKRVLRYLVTTSNLGILFKRPDGNPSRNLETITIDGWTGETVLKLEEASRAIL